MKSEMNISPEFSIIVPVYNNEQTIGRCIESLLQQTYTNFELLLVDDGSVDRSGQICDEHAGKDSRIRVFHNPNQGVSMARNHALSVAKGKYINFVDSDDWVTTDYLERYVETRKDFDFDLVYTEMVRVFENGKRKFTSLKQLETRNRDGLADVLSFLLECMEFGYACNKSFKREIISSNNLFFNKEYRHFEDALFTINYCLYIDSVKSSPFLVYYYCIRIQLSTPIRKDMFSPAHSGIQALSVLAERLQSESFKKAVRIFNQEWLWNIMPFVYVFKGKLSKKMRFGFLEDLRYWFDSSGSFSERISRKGRMISFLIKIKSDVILNFIFRTIGFIYRIKSNLMNKRL